MLIAMDSTLASEKRDCGCVCGGGCGHMVGVATGRWVGGGFSELVSIAPRDSGIGGTGELGAGGGGGEERGRERERGSGTPLGGVGGGVLGVSRWLIG